MKQPRMSYKGLATKQKSIKEKNISKSDFNLNGQAGLFNRSVLAKEQDNFKPKNYNYESKEETEEYFLGKDPRKTKEYKQLAKEQESQDAQELALEYGASEKKSFSNIVNSEITPTQKRNYFLKQINSELKKDKPNYTAVAYYRGEIAKIPRGYLYPVIKKN